MKIETKRTHILRMRKRQLKFIGHIMRKDCLKNTKGKIGRVKQRTTYLIILFKQMASDQEGSKKTKLTKSYKEYGVLESDEPPRNEGTWYIEEN